MPHEEIDRGEWRIYRLELIFLNPEEYRWQVFQYWPGFPGNSNEPPRRNGEAIYRTQAQQLLHWVYEAAKDGFADPLPVPDVRIDTAAIWNRMLERIDGGSPRDKARKLRERLDDICEHVGEICKGEGIPRRHVQIIRRISPHGGCIELGAREALDLVSALYVAHDWDVWGRLAFPAKPGMGVEPDIPPNPARLGSFSYVIDYPEGSADNLLGYPVDLLCSVGTRLPAKDPGSRNSTDEDAIAASRIKFGALAEYGDYFEHCNDIRRAQHDSYRLYGYLIDEIAKDVADETTIFIRCFPLRICGYDHFIQVLLQPTQRRSIGNAGITLPKVFANPPKDAPAGELPELLILKECLREMIVQMHIAAFQRAALDELDDPGKVTPRTPEQERELFARHAPNLVRMDRIWVNDHVYAYVPDGKLRLNRWKPIEEDDDRLAKLEGASGDDRFLEMSCGVRAHIPWEDDFKSLSALLGGTGKMRLEEQWEWLKEMIQRRRAAEKMEQLAKSQNRRGSR